MKKKNKKQIYGTITLLGDPQIKIHDPNSVGYVIVNGKEITVYFKNGKIQTSIMSLTAFELQCDPKQFCRIHSKYLINMNYVESKPRNGRSYKVKMKNGKMLDVSVKKKDIFLALAKIYMPR